MFLAQEKELGRVHSAFSEPMYISHDYMFLCYQKMRFFSSLYPKTSIVCCYGYPREIIYQVLFSCRKPCFISDVVTFKITRYETLVSSNCFYLFLCPFEIEMHCHKSQIRLRANVQIKIQYVQLNSECMGFFWTYNTMV